MKNPLRLFIALILATVVALSGCDTRIVRSGLYDYSLIGAVVKNIDNDSILAAALLKKEDSAVAGAVIRINNDTLKYSGGLYYRSYNSDTLLRTGNYRLRILDSTFFADSLLFTVPADLQITSIFPASRINGGGATTVRVDWTASGGSNGYAYGVVLRESAYQTNGYFGFVPDGATLVTIPPDAFRLSGQLDTGWYYIYVYAYYGSPVPGGNLPTGFPAGLAPNIARNKFTGSWGAIVVSPRDSMYVTLQ
ncbi:MAG: hypothetical protein AB1690_11595 [Candidatus Zixiibacteriota bacterium]